MLDGFSTVKHLVYAVDMEQDRPLFLLTNTDNQTGISERTIYRSTDNGVTWQRFELPPEIVPTTMAISPNFAQDGLLFVGTTDGQVITLPGM